MGPLSMGLDAAKAGVGAYAALQKGAADAATFKYQQGVAMINKQIDDQNADYERKVGEVQAQESGLKTAYQIGETKAIQSGSNLDVNTGTNAQVRTSEHDIGAEDQAIIRSSAAKRAYGFDVKGVQDVAQANIFGMAASQSQKAGKLGAITSILGGASSIASKWSQGSSIGMMGGE